MPHTSHLKSKAVLSAIFATMSLGWMYSMSMEEQKELFSVSESLQLSRLRGANSTNHSSSDELSSDILYEPWRTMPVNVTRLETEDIIYGRRQIFDAPIVIEEFKLVFFDIPKVASSEWKRLFIRLHGMPKEKWCNTTNEHNRTFNGLKFLNEFSVEEAQKMMVSPEWTRAIFVRHPKPRILSAFLDKAVKHPKEFVNRCKHFAYMKSMKGTDETAQTLHLNECRKRSKNFDFFIYNITTLLPDRHWLPIYSLIDEKWWPWINFVGRMEDMSDHAESLLKAIKSDRDGMSAWDRVGKTGWSGNEKSGDCNGTKAFFQTVSSAHHSTNAKEKIQKYFTPEIAEFVEEHYADDLDNPYFHFDE